MYVTNVSSLLDMMYKTCLKKEKKKSMRNNNDSYLDEHARVCISLINSKLLMKLNFLKKYLKVFQNNSLQSYNK